MRTVAEIIAERDAAVNVLAAQITQAQLLQNRTTSETTIDRLEGVIMALEDKKNQVSSQLYERALSHADTTQALNTLKAATAELNETAKKLVNV